MNMRTTLVSLIICLEFGAFAQAPPIDLEWSAIRPYPSVPGANVHIARDPVFGQYVWAVEGLDLISDEFANVFLPTGTDVTPSNPISFNVGSLDALVDLAVQDSTIHSLMHHMNISGSPQDVYWHLDGNAIQTDGDGTLQDHGNDMLVTEAAVYGCGSTDVNFIPTITVARAVKQDLQGNLLWNITWSDPNNDIASFSSVAEMGDSVFCAAFPNVVILDGSSGSLIDAYDLAGENLIGDARLLAHGSRLYWCISQGSELHFGQFDFAIDQGQVASVTVGDQSGKPCIAVDDQDRLWLTTTSLGQGRWYQWDYNLEPLGSGTLYASIDDMCFVNGKLSMTGTFDSTSSAAYLITGTPQQ